MKTKCNEEKVKYQSLGSRDVIAEFDGGAISSDGGGLLLREVENIYGIIQRFSECFSDHRDPSKVEHSIQEILKQRIFGLCLGYEDLNDHDKLRGDPLLATLVGKDDPAGKDRARDRDKGKPLASRSTLNRLETGKEDQAPEDDRYKKIMANSEKLRNFFVDNFLEIGDVEGEWIALDLDSSDDPLHGDQLGKFFHGFYYHYCYLPLFIFCGRHLLSARLRKSNIGDTVGVIEELEEIVPRLKQKWPEKKILIRGDSGFSTDQLMSWCENNEVRYVFGKARNQRLEDAISDQMRDAEAVYEETRIPTRFYRDFSYKTLKSWSRERRVVGKAEYLPKGKNHRFVVTNVFKSEMAPAFLYENIYCVRGEMENRIKEHQTQLFSTRTSTHWMESNQIRLWFSSVAYTLMDRLRECLKGTELEDVYPATIRERLLKIGAHVKVSVRRVVVSLSSFYPFGELFREVSKRLKQLARLPKPRPAPV